jgi:hypothetical protein
MGPSKRQGQGEQCQEPAGAEGPNAQMTVLYFPIFTLLHPPAGGPPAKLVNLRWPHISVATLREAFN